jgi:hypothetical protein
MIVSCSILDMDAIRVTFGDIYIIQPCLFHVARCWIYNLATKVDFKVIRGHIMAELTMHKTCVDSMVEKVNNFREKWKGQQPQFVEYLEDRWLASEGYKKWSAAYFIEEHKQMSTNNSALL